MNRKKLWIGILVFLLLGIVCVGGVYILAEHFSNKIKTMEIRKIQETSDNIERTLFKSNIYLRPDTAYFYKLEHLLKSGRLRVNMEDFSGMIRKNLSKGASYDANIHSVYTALADEEAKFMLVNGSLCKMDSLNDLKWLETCDQMQENSYLSWREINSSFLNQVELITWYRAYDSVSYDDGRTVRGYMVINYYRNHMMNELNMQISSQESVVLYNPREETFLTTGKDFFVQYDINDLLVRDMEGGIQERSGLVKAEDGSKLIYSISKSAYVPLYYVVLKEDTEIHKFMAEIYFSIFCIVFLLCFFTMVFILMYYRQYKNYLGGLVQVITAVEQDGSDEKQMLQELTSRMQNSAIDLKIIARKILNDKMDIHELKSALSSEQRLRTEVEMLYGHAQINSHFLLNTLDSIYWESIKNHGDLNGETKMIEMLCVILKYALDSSDLYISLEEELNCAKNYIQIQQMRKKRRINAVWIVPDGLKKAKVGKLILQPILENSIQHGGYSDEVAEIKLKVEARLIDKMLYLLVSDNGLGIDENEMRRMNKIFRQDVPVRSKHVGLLNVNRRIQLQYGPEYGIVLQPAGDYGGLQVVISLCYMTI